MSPLQPPAPFQDFQFSYDPALAALFQTPPPSADLFSPSETTDLLGFLDNFEWNFGQQIPESSTSTAPYSNPHLNTAPTPSTSSTTRPRRTASTRGSSHLHNDTPGDMRARRNSVAESTTSGSPNPSTPTFSSNPDSSAGRSASRSKQLLSTPQKRLNHIMSEQKRRNAIRDGYAQLISLLAPAGAPGIDMPTRGRPKGSGTHAKGQTKGKSGVLFRAVEYCRWLEEGRDALMSEVLRVEAAAGIHP